MRKTLFALAFLFCLPNLHAQDRPLIIAQGDNLEADPPQSIEEMASVTNVVAHVRIASRTASLDPDGVMIWSYKAELLDVAGNPEGFETGQTEIEITEPGGVFYNGAIIRVNDNENTANLVPNEEYVVFLTDHPSPHYVLLWGKYAAFQVVSGFVVPLVPSGHKYFELYGGMRMSDFLLLADRDISRARSDLNLPARANRAVR